MKKRHLNLNVKYTITSIILIAFLVITNQSYAFTFQSENSIQNTQSFIKYKGRVIDSETKRALSFADINIKTTNVSTITNREGKFSIKVPNMYSEKTISISFLGYETKDILINDLKLKNNVIALKPSLTTLSTIQINAPKDAKALVKATLNSKGGNYTEDHAIMTAFYRETIKKGRKNASLTEAVVKIFKKPYPSSKRDNIELIKARKSTNYSRLDTLAVKLQGGPYSTLYSDIIKYPQYIFNEETLPYYEFNFEPSTQINDRQVYVVKFKQLPNIVTPFFYGKLFIDAETFALVSGKYQLNVENKYESAKLFLRRKPRQVRVEPVEAIYKVDYKTNNGEWYYSYSNIQLAFKVKWRKKLFSSTYTLNIEMAVTNWKQNLISEKINPKKRIKPTIILSDETSGFSDPTFWGEYNIIEPEKSIESAIKKIAKQLSKIKAKK